MKFAFYYNEVTWASILAARARFTKPEARGAESSMIMSAMESQLTSNSTVFALELLQSDKKGNIKYPH